MKNQVIKTRQATTIKNKKRKNNTQSFYIQSVRKKASGHKLSASPIGLALNNMHLTTTLALKYMQRDQLK